MLQKEELPIEKYLPFKFSDNLSKNEILKKTKVLIKNSDKYNSYCKSYTENTQTTSFKLPEVTTYPIFKNQEMIPVAKTNYDVSNDSWGYKFMFDDKPMTPKGKTVMQHTKTKTNAFNFSKDNFKSRSDNKNVNSEDSVNCAQYPNLTNNEKKLYRLATLPNKGTFKNPINELENFGSDSSLVYDCNIIFNKIEFYENLIKNKIEYFKSNKNENGTTYLIKKINKDSSNEMILTLNSIKIEFKNLIETRKPPMTFYFPLALLPVFYLNNIEVLKNILLSILKFNENFDDVSFDEDELYKMLNNMNEFKSEENFIIDRIKNKKFFFLKKNKENVIIFNWITTTNAFEVQIRLPEVHVEIPKEKINIKKFIDPELLFYIYSLNFNQWDFYVCNYLVSYRDFRNFIRKTFSKTRILNTVQKTKIVINNERTDDILFSKEIKVSRFSENENNFSYFYTYKEDNKLKNQMHTINSFNLNVRDNENSISDNLTFNIKQMKVIHRLTEDRDDIDLTSFFKKIIIVDPIKETVAIDDGFFENLDETYFKLTKSLYSGEASSQQSKGGLTIVPILPFIDKYSISNGVIIKIEEDCESITLSNDFVKILCSSPITKWSEIIMKEAAWLTSMNKNNIVKTDNKKKMSMTNTPKMRLNSAFERNIKTPNKLSSLFKGFKLPISEGANQNDKEKTYSNKNMFNLQLSNRSQQD